MAIFWSVSSPPLTSPSLHRPEVPDERIPSSRLPAHASVLQLLLHAPSDAANDHGSSRTAAGRCSAQIGENHLGLRHRLAQVGFEP